MPKPHLQHLHLPGLTPYSTAQSLQATLIRQLLFHKALLSTFLPTPSTPLPPSPPPATILTFTPPPTYTTGRRELPSSYPPSLIATLKAPLDASTPPAAFSPTTRGGLITFHGPGQLVIYPTLSLTKPASLSAPLSPRCYVRRLEDVTIALLARYGVAGFRTKDPGVWVRSRASGHLAQARGEMEEKKIAALGVHLRRNVTGYGVGLNVGTDLRWFDRIVACGIEGKGVTSLEAERGGENVGLEEVAEGWVGEFAREGGVEVRRVAVGEVLGQLGVEGWEELVREEGEEEG